MGAIVLGAIAGIVCFWAVASLKKTFGYDDSLDVFGVHGVGGIVGAIGIGILASPGLGGAGFGGEIKSVGGQLTAPFAGVGFTIVYTAIATFIILKLVDMFTGLRVSDEQETEGLDVAEHGESAYS
jgi:ammonium transporter, Amt family